MLYLNHIKVFWGTSIEVFLPFEFSDMTSLLFLTLVSFLAAYCLTKIYQKIQQHWKFHFREIIPLKEKHPTDVMATLHGTDKDSIKTLIRNENKSNRVLSQTLRLINMDGTGSEDLASRRQVNKSFFQCLIDVQLSRAAALVWLKKHIDPEVCDTILSDDNYSG